MPQSSLASWLDMVYTGGNEKVDETKGGSDERISKNGKRKERDGEYAKKAVKKREAGKHTCISLFRSAEKIYQYMTCSKTIYSKYNIYDQRSVKFVTKGMRYNKISPI